MFNQIKDKLIYLYLSGKKEIWGNNQGSRILVQTNDFFSLTSWRDSIKDNELSIQASNLNFQFVKRKVDLIKNFSTADAAFLFGFSRYFLLENNQKKLLYFPAMGKEIFNSSKFSGRVSLLNNLK